MKAFLVSYPIAVFLTAIAVIAAQFDYSGVDWPAWVQAVGSVFAIFAAIGIAMWQNRLQRAEREHLRSQDDDARVLQFHLICTALLSALGKLRPHVKEAAEHDYFLFSIPDFNDLREMLIAVPLASLDRLTLARLFAIRAVLSDVHIRFGVRGSESNTVSWQEDWAWIDTQIEKVLGVVRSSMKTLKDRGIEQREYFE